MTNILYHNNQAKIESYVQEKNAECDRILNEKISQLEEKRKTREDECIARYDDEKKEIKQQRKILKRLQEQISEEVYSVRRQDLQEEADAMRAQIRKMRKSEPGTKEVLLAMFTYAGTTLLFNAFMPRQKTNLLADMSKKNKRTEYAYHIIEKVIIDAFVPAAVAFVVYFLLGFLIDGANHFGDMAGFAIAIGGTAAKAIRFDQCDFLI